jgi:hypothetical protein
VNAIVPWERLTDLADAVQPEPTDLDVVMAVAEAFDMPLLEVIERLICVDIVTVRRLVSP